MRIRTLVSIMDRQLEEMYGPICEQFCVSPAGLDVLEALHKQDGQKPSEIARQIGRAATSFTPILDNLVDKGFLCRQSHPSDRRSVLIFLTPKGKSIRSELALAMERAEAEVRTKLLDRFIGQSITADILDRLFAPLPSELTLSN